MRNSRTKHFATFHRKARISIKVSGIETWDIRHYTARITDWIIRSPFMETIVGHISWAVDA